MAFTTSISLDALRTVQIPNSQTNSDVIGLANGGFATVSELNDSIRVSFFDRDANFVGQTAALPGHNSAIARLDNGNVVITTTTELPEDGTFKDAITYRIFNASGVMVASGSPADSNSSNSDVAALVGGGFVFVDEDDFATESDIDVSVRNADGCLLTEFTVDASNAIDEKPAVIGLADGGFIVAWQRFVSGSGYEVWYAIYNADGTQRIAPHVALNSSGQDPSITALSDGGFAIAYEQVLNADRDVNVTEGTPTDGVFSTVIDLHTGSESSPEIATLSNGMLVFATRTSSGSSFTNYIRIYDPLMDQFSQTFFVNGEPFSAMAALGGGKFVAVTSSGVSQNAIAHVGELSRIWMGDGASDVMAGDSLSDFMNGGAGNDSLAGGGGDDILNGGANNDIYTGGAGADLFQVGMGRDTILDFTLRGPEADNAFLDAMVGGATMVDVRRIMTQVGPNTVINFGGGNDLTLRNVLASDLRFEHFSNLRAAWINDFNGDHRGDMLWRNSDGTLVSWEISAGATSFNSHSFGTIDPNWRIAEIGDFNADGRVDVLWRHADNTTVAWLMNETSFTSLSLGAPDSSWRVAETGDLNNDGRSDILWRHASGTLVVWYMSENGVASTQTYNGTDSSWHIVGTGDFIGNKVGGDEGILWRNNDGTVVAWNLDPDTGALTSSKILGGPDNTWRIEGTGDFAGAGHDDVLWRNTITGEVIVWDTINDFFFTTRSLGGPDNSWQIQDVADFNSDGRADILWRHSSGQTVEWLLNVNFTFSTQTLGAPGSTWSVVSDPTDFV